MTPLEDLLQQCTVKITIPGGWGTGFFVAPGLILTCAHVVRKAADLRVTVSSPVLQQPLSAIVKAKADDGKTLDLALVELSEPLPDHPCVLLDEEPVDVGQALYSYGYLESYANPAPVRPINEGLTGDTPPLLNLQGAQIGKGISGAALLNLKTGKVCGMVKETRAAGFDLGGGVIPTSVILEQFPELRELQRKFHLSDCCWDKLLPTIHSSETLGDQKVQQYLQLLSSHYEKWWDIYRLTEVISARHSTFTFEQIAQTEERSKKDPTRKETVLLPQLLQGIIGYAESEPVLLVGSPGVGKSTTLLRLLAVLAKQELQKSVPRIPVLIRLKDYQPSLSGSEDSSGMLALIKEALEPELSLEISGIKALLFQEKRLFLLLDGLNELPTDVVRSKLTNFRDQCKRAEIPLICTTRDLGDDFSIQRRVNLQPLSHDEIRRFLSECMQGKEQQVLQLLNKGNQELGKTPFVLWMLYDVSRNLGQVPESLGEAFSRFTKNYTNYKINQEGIPYSPETLQHWSFSLEYLAFEMLKSPDPEDPGLIIAEMQVANVLTQFPSKNAINLFQSQALLNNLLKYHLLQKSHRGKVSFCHQLIQEYYAAEHLLSQLSQHPEWLEKEDGQDYTHFQKKYLNYLKWTEPLALMLALVEEKAQALRVVRLALDVDLMLGARLAGKVKWEFQADTISEVVKQIVPEWLKIFLLGETKSPKAADELIKTMKQHSNPTTRGQVVWASRHLKGKFIMPLISEAIKDDDPHVREVALRTIAESDIEKAVELVAEILPKEPVTSVREVAVIIVLEKSISEASILSLLYATLDAERNVYVMADHILKKIDRDTLLPVLAKILKNKDVEPTIRQRAAHQLGDLGDESTLRDLFEAQLDLNLNIHEEAADALEKIRSKPIRKDIHVHNNEEKKRENQINDWLSYLKSEEPIPRGNAVFHLAQLLDKEVAVHLVSQALDDSDHYVRGHAITSLIKLIGREALPHAIRALDDVHYEVRNQASQALLSIKDSHLKDIEIPPKIIDNLVDTLNKSQEPDELIKATKILVDLCQIVPGQLLHDNLENAFIDASHNANGWLRRTATQGLGMFANKRSGDRLLKILEEDNDDMVILGAIKSLKKMPCEITQIYLSELALLISTVEKSLIIDALLFIQNRCQFYNYEIWQAHLTAQEADRQTHPNSDPNAITIQTLGSLTIMTDKAPNFNQQHATIGVNYAAEGSKVEVTQHTSSSEQTFEILLADYQQFIQQLQQKYPTLADATTIPQIIEVEAKLKETQDQQWWQNFLSLKRLWNGGKKAAVKVGEHFVESNPWGKGAIAFLEGISEDGN